MTEEKFIEQIWSIIVEHTLSAYHDILEGTDRSTVTDSYWKEVLKLYDSLDETDKSTILKIMQQSFVDGISNSLGLIDGKMYLENQEEDFELTYKDEKLNGILSDLFIARAEEKDM